MDKTQFVLENETHEFLWILFKLENGGNQKYIPYNKKIDHYALGIIPEGMW